MKFSLYFDGSKKGQDCSYGFLIYDSDKLILKQHGNYCKPIISSHDAEFIALIMGMIYALSLGIKDIDIYGDSLHVIKQSQVKCRIRSPITWVLRLVAVEVSKIFNTITFTWIPRNMNIEAHREAK